MSERSNPDRYSRRQVLLGGGSAGLAAVSAGCVRRARSIVSRSRPDQVSLSITCVPAEEDSFPVQIVDPLRTNLDAVGISTSVNYRSFEEYRLDVLVNHDFDIAVGRLPGQPDPDFLYGLFHSSFSAERGWQNPYGFSSATLDEQLRDQRSESGTRRREKVGDVLETVAREQPLAPLVAPVEHRVVRQDRYDGFGERTFADPTDVLALDPGERRDSLRFTIGFTAPTKNLNPLSVEHRTKNIVPGLVYDSLLVRDDREYYPWLAESIEWTDDSAVVSLRDAFWHDGEPVTSADVGFTYRLLQDSTVGEGDSPVPAPQYRSRSALVDEIVENDNTTIEFVFDGSEEVAPRALTVPILPVHEWGGRTETADVSGLEGDSVTTEALVTENIPPVGSGPYRFVDRSQRDYVKLELVEDHFSTVVDELSKFDPPAESITVVVAPSEAGAIRGVKEGDFDFNLSPIAPGGIDIEEDESVAVSATPARAIYHVGYNTRREPMSNVSLRRIVSMLLDRAWITEEVFSGKARPVVTPITDDHWVPARLQWDGEDPEVPFLGTDGALDVERAREVLVESGYQYDEDGNLRGTLGEE